MILNASCLWICYGWPHSLACVCISLYGDLTAMKIAANNLSDYVLVDGIIEV